MSEALQEAIELVGQASVAGYSAGIAFVVLILLIRRPRGGE